MPWCRKPPPRDPLRDRYDEEGIEGGGSGVTSNNCDLAYKAIMTDMVLVSKNPPTNKAILPCTLLLLLLLLDEEEEDDNGAAQVDLPRRLRGG